MPRIRPRVPLRQLEERHSQLIERLQIARRIDLAPFEEQAEPFGRLLGTMHAVEFQRQITSDVCVAIAIYGSSWKRIGMNVRQWVRREPPSPTPTDVIAKALATWRGRQAPGVFALPRHPGVVRALPSSAKQGWHEAFHGAPFYALLSREFFRLVEKAASPVDVAAVLQTVQGSADTSDAPSIFAALDRYRQAQSHNAELDRLQRALSTVADTVEKRFEELAREADHRPDWLYQFCFECEDDGRYADHTLRDLDALLGLSPTGFPGPEAIDVLGVPVEVALQDRRFSDNPMFLALVRDHAVDLDVAERAALQLNHMSLGRTETHASRFVEGVF